MENAEEVMQLLEEFSKIKPKDIPRELEDYLGYVAKTGDPVYQWSLVKHLFREKLISVITDFYESTLTVDLPPCPNVDPFNYERMKSSLLERFDTFCSAPFTVQRICELLTNPRKEYNRADKYMRAIEKNILVVSTREPGTGKRPLECDIQPETVLNGMPDVKLSDSDGGLLHVPTDLPYLGAPPASNDVIVETTETNLNVNDRSGIDSNVEPKKLKTDTDRPTHESNIAEESKQASPKLEVVNSDVPLSIEDKSPEDNECDTNDRLINISNSNLIVTSETLSEEENTAIFEAQDSKSILPDSIDSSPDESNEVIPEPTVGLVTEDVGSVSDENEVSSTPVEATDDLSNQGDVEEPTDSEAEATNTSITQDAEADVNSLPEDEIICSERLIETSETEAITISETLVTKTDEVNLECNEITGTVDSPVSPGNGTSLKDDGLQENINLNIIEESEHPDSHPDSSNDICIQNKNTVVDSSKPESCAEADSMSERNVLSDLDKTDLVENAPDETNNEVVISENILESSTQDASSRPKLNVTEDLCSPIEKTKDSDLSSNLSEDAAVSEGPCTFSMAENANKLIEVASSSEITEDMCDQERREGSIIQSVPNITPDSQQHITPIEDISVDPSCEAEEEAMDVDDSSNQMMVSEGENEGEPMDQCDQLQS